MSTKKGFTLVEILVVISLISFLASIIIVSMEAARSKAYNVAARTEAHQVQIAVQSYEDDTGLVPALSSAPHNYTVESSDSGSAWASLWKPLVSGGYISGIPSSGDPSHPMTWTTWTDTSGNTLGVLGYYQSSDTADDGNRCYPYTDQGSGGSTAFAGGEAMMAAVPGGQPGGGGSQSQTVGGSSGSLNCDLGVSYCVNMGASGAEHSNGLLHQVQGDGGTGSTSTTTVGDGGDGGGTLPCEGTDNCICF